MKSYYVASAGVLLGAFLANLQVYYYTKFSKIRAEGLSPFLPYCVKKEGSGWIVLNRDYKPLGVVSRVWVPYEDFPNHILPPEAIDFSYLYATSEILFHFWSTEPPWSSRKAMENYEEVFHKVFKNKYR